MGINKNNSIDNRYIKYFNLPLDFNSKSLEDKIYTLDILYPKTNIDKQVVTRLKQQILGIAIGSGL